MPRTRRLLAVARYELRCHMTGRQGLRLLGVAAALLLPVGLVPTPKLRPADPPPVMVEEARQFGPPPPAKVQVRGEIPPALGTRLEWNARSGVEVHGHDPVIVTTPFVSNEMRAALETLDGPVRLEVRSHVIPGRMPGRSLLIAILAISLLTGPLADTLPGERARRTLEVLLTAGITRGELIGGKWFAWTISATATAGVSAALACWRGLQAPGWWLVGLPLFIGSAIALGLWLVRLVDDVVGGSAAPMRVLPVAAGTMAAVALAISGVSPVAAAAVPLGGSLLVAAGMFSSGPQVLAATASTVVFVIAMLSRTGGDLDRVDTFSSPTRWGAMGLSMVAILLWWLTVAGPGVWGAGAAGTATNLITSTTRSMLVGGIALLACALITMARQPRRGPAVAIVSPPLAALILATTGVAVALAISGPVPVLELVPARAAVDVMLDRLRQAAVPAAMLLSAGAMFAAVTSIVGQALMFRNVVATQLGWIPSSLLWCMAVSPSAPWAVVAASFALGALAHGYGWRAALVAQLAWAVAASAGLHAGQISGAGAPGAIDAYAGGGGRLSAVQVGLQMIALAIALGALRLSRGVPTRHQL